MGMYDTVNVPCPKCGEVQGFQSKSGQCLLQEFDLDNCPPDVLQDVNRHSPATCTKCNTKFWVGEKKVPASVVWVERKCLGCGDLVTGSFDWCKCMEKR